MENFGWLIANGIGFALKRWTGYRKIIPWIVVASVFMGNLAKAVVTGEADVSSAAPDSTLVGMIGFFSWGTLSGIFLPVVKESAYALGMHTFGKNAIMQGLLPVLFKRGKKKK